MLHYEMFFKIIAVAIGVISALCYFMYKHDKEINNQIEKDLNNR